MAQIRPTHSRCSGFISTERKQARAGRSFFIPAISAANKSVGSSATARCRFLRAEASKIFLVSTEASATLAARGANTTMSSSGGNAVINRLSPSNLRCKSSAASRQDSRPLANSPPLASGRSFCVDHSATADAPAREHSRLISPRCSSLELK